MEDEKYLLRLYGASSVEEVSEVIENDHIKLINEIGSFQNPKAGIPKHQHINPVLSLKRFSDQNERLVRVDSEEAKEIGVRDSAVRKNFYNAPILYSDQYALERFFGNIEAKAGPILEKMANEGKLYIDSDEIEHLARFVAAQCIRSYEYRDFFKSVTYSTLSKEIVSKKQNILDEYKDVDDLMKRSSLLDDFALYPDKYVEFHNDYYSVMAMRYFEFFVRDLRKRSILIKEFNIRRLITSPNPVAALNSDGTDAGMKFFNSNVFYALSRNRFILFKKKQMFSEIQSINISTGTSSLSKNFNSMIRRRSHNNVFFVHPADVTDLPYLQIPSNIV